MLTSPEGWDVSYGTDTQLSEISDVQATSFFEPSALPLLDPFLLESFRGDVSTTLGRKYEYLDSRRFAPLVTTASRDDEDESSATRRWPSNASSDERPRPVVGVVELSIQRDDDVLKFLSNAASKFSPCYGDDGDDACDAASGDDWNDGLGTNGGDMQRWADARRARMNAEEDAAAAATTATTTRAPTRSPRPGRWRGGAPADEYAYVSCMCVADAYRRRGIADALMNAAEEITLRWGYDVACLHVYQRNAGAIALYRRRGYEIVDDGCPPFDAMLGKRRFLMMKRLRGRVVGEEYQDID